MAQLAMISELSNGAVAMGLTLTPVKMKELLAYVELLIKWNKTYNLTAVRDLQSVVPMHLLDSLSAMPYLDQTPLLDVGSGGGMPGIPVAIAMPSLQVALIDSNSKKSAFQQQVVIELGLGNVTVSNERVEAYRPAHKFGQIVSRAFSEIAEFVSVTRHLIAEGGRWVAMKGVYPEQELSRLPSGVIVEAVHRIVVPGVAGERHLVILRERPT